MWLVMTEHELEKGVRWAHWTSLLSFWNQINKTYWMLGKFYLAEVNPVKTRVQMWHYPWYHDRRSCWKTHDTFNVVVVRAMTQSRWAQDIRKPEHGGWLWIWHFLPLSPSPIFFLSFPPIIWLFATCVVLYWHIQPFTFKCSMQPQWRC